MACDHHGYHTVRSEYHPGPELLIYLWICERCGARLGEARRMRYRPRFNPRGNDGYLTASRS